MSFVHVVTPRFFEIDRAGIVFFGRVFEYCHAAFEELFVELRGGLSRVIDDDRLGLPLVHAEADFRAPIRLGDRIAVEVRVARLSERSVTFAFTLRGDDGVVRATALHKHALVSLPGFSPVAAPQWLVDGLEERGLVGGDERA